MMRTANNGSDRLKFPHRFKKMYALTGQVRDRQLCIHRLKESSKKSKLSFAGKIAGLKKEIIDLAKKKDDWLSKKELAEIENGIIKKVPPIQSGAPIKKFFQQQTGIIKDIISRGNYPDKELHKIRKKIKDVVYIMEIFRQDLKKRLPFSFWDKAELKKAEDLADRLGSFNDAATALAFIKPADIQKAASPEKENLRALRSQWLAEKRRLKKEILSMMPTIKLDVF